MHHNYVHVQCTHVHVYMHTIIYECMHVQYMCSFSHSVGGYDGQSFLDTVESYDPSTKQWSTLKPMTCRRSKNIYALDSLYFYIHIVHVQYSSCGT